MKPWVTVMILLSLLITACTMPIPGSSQMSESEMLIETVAALNEVDTTPASDQGGGATGEAVVSNAAAAAGEPAGPARLSVKPRYQAQPGTPAGIPNFVSPEAGCNWLGVGGQVFDRSNAPQSGLIVQVTGVLEGQDVLMLAMTGSAPALGPGGYLLTLADHQVTSQDTLYIQVFDQDATPVSTQVPFLVATPCDQNMVLVNFSELTLDKRFYIPSVPRDAQEIYLPNVQGN